MAKLVPASFALTEEEKNDISNYAEINGTSFSWLARYYMKYAHENASLKELRKAIKKDPKAAPKGRWA
jgi:hypothetical protein